MRSTTEQDSPETTPLLIKRLILVTALSSFFCSLSEVFINNVFDDLPGPMTFLTLNKYLFFKGYIFQLVTYPLTYGELGGGVTFFYMITLMASLYIIWMTGTHIVEKMGTRSFAQLYLFSTLMAGITGVVLALPYSANVIFSGCIPQMLGLLVAWTMLNSEGKIYLLSPIPIGVKWLTLCILLIALVPPLTSLQLPVAGFYMAGALSGWLFALFSWHIKSPWLSMKELESQVLGLIAKIKLFFKPKKSSKIIDIRSIKEEDDLFMDEMLEKISKEGESALTPTERKRMQKISRKKNLN